MFLQMSCVLFLSMRQMLSLLRAPMKFYGKDNLLFATPPHAEAYIQSLVLTLETPSFEGLVGDRDGLQRETLGTISE